jgi:sulfonate transport system ATP-binding protein
MAQRVALGRTLAYEPDLVLLDEPFGSLDYFTRRGLWREMGELHRRTGRTFLLVTHDVEEALALGDSVLVLRGGGAGDRVDIPFPRPRDPADFPFIPLRRRIFAAIGGSP